MIKSKRIVLFLKILACFITHINFGNLRIQSKYGKVTTIENSVLTPFTQCYLHSPVNTYFHLLIHTYVFFIILYEFDKIDKIWEM